nr:uncharacterized protein LOC106025044 [Cavia porcellus]
MRSMPRSANSDSHSLTPLGHNYRGLKTRAFKVWPIWKSDVAKDPVTEGKEDPKTSAIPLPQTRVFTPCIITDSHAISIRVHLGSLACPGTLRKATHVGSTEPYVGTSHLRLLVGAGRGGRSGRGGLRRWAGPAHGGGAPGPPRPARPSRPRPAASLPRPPRVVPGGHPGRDFCAAMAQHFSLAACDVVGFDLDHTLCRYNLPESAPLIYNSFAQFLVKEKGYDKELLTVTPEDWDFCCKGLALDLEDGTFIKLADDGTVLRASRGTKMMPPDMLAKEYGTKEWKYFVSDTGMPSQPGKYYFYDNYFDLPGALLCARVVDSLTKQNSGQKTFDFWKDIVAGIQHNFKMSAFKVLKPPWLVGTSFWSALWTGRVECHHSTHNSYRSQCYVMVLSSLTPKNEMPYMCD